MRAYRTRGGSKSQAFGRFTQNRKAAKKMRSGAAGGARFVGEHRLARCAPHYIALSHWRAYLQSVSILKCSIAAGGFHGSAAKHTEFWLYVYWHTGLPACLFNISLSPLFLLLSVILFRPGIVYVKGGISSNDYDRS